MSNLVHKTTGPISNLSYYGNDIFAIDMMFKRVMSFGKVNKVELYVFTTIKYYKNGY
jgi:hypothetical protein